MIIVPSNA